MRNLLKADFRKFLKGKLITATVILMVVFTLFSGFTYFLIRAELDELIALVNPLSILSSSFSPISNFGLIFLIFLIIILATEFNHNTIRNKVIAGYSRQQIYFSTLIFNLVVTSIVFLCYSLLQFLVAGLIVGFSGVTFFKVLEVLGVYLFATLLFYSIVQLVVYITRSTVASIAITVGGTFILVILVTLLMQFTYSDKINANTIKVIITVFPVLRLPMDFLLMSSLKMSKLDSLWSILSSIGLVTLITLLGNWINKRKDYN